jgi:hypothetical protein
MGLEVSRMPRRRSVVPSVALTLGLSILIAVLALGSGRPSGARAAFQVHSLVGECNAQIGSYAVAYGAPEVRVLGGTPQILMVRSVTAAEIPALGIGTPPQLAGSPPLCLVVLGGDFDVSGLEPDVAPTTWHSTVAYIAYVFDLQAGMAAMTATSWRGGEFRTLLNNPNLPADTPMTTPAVKLPQASPVPTPQLSAAVRTYGAVAPPVTTPR